MKNFIVYKHTTPSQKIYIGITGMSTSKRWGHKGYGYRNQPYFYRAILKYGWDNIKHEVLTIVKTREEAIALEVHYIKEYNSNNPKYGYNNTEGGDGISGYKCTDKHKEQLRQYRLSHPLGPESLKKISIANTGKKRSQETIQKMKEAPFHQSEEYRVKLSKACKGKKRSEKERLRISKMNKGRACTWNYVPVDQFTKEGVFLKTWTNQMEAEKELHITAANICSCCKNRLKSAGGYTWKYHNN